MIHAGGKEGILDTSVAFGSADFTAAALAAKGKGVNAIYGAMDDNSNFALATAMKQAGIKLKAVVFPTGYEPSAITSPAWTDLQGDYFASEFRPFQLPNAGTTHMQAALEKYDGFKKSGFPTFEQYESWAGADLMIKGMQLAGSTLTHAAIIKSLRGIKSYDANGLLATPSTTRPFSGTIPPKPARGTCRPRPRASFPSRASPSAARTSRGQRPPPAASERASPHHLGLTLPLFSGGTSDPAMMPGAAATTAGMALTVRTAATG